MEASPPLAPPPPAARRRGPSATVVLWAFVGFMALALVGYFAYGVLYDAGIIPHRHDIHGTYQVVAQSATDALKVNGSSCRIESPDLIVDTVTVMSVEDGAELQLARTNLGDGRITSGWGGTMCEFLFTLRDIPEVPSYTVLRDGAQFEKLDLAEMMRRDWKVGAVHILDLHVSDDLR